jgi:hypothetical protein
MGHFRPNLRGSPAVQCLLFPKSDLPTARQRNDAKGHKRTHAPQQVLFDDLIGKLLDVQGYIKAENLRDLKIDDNLEFCRILHR